MENKFIIVIGSRNNEKWIESNLNSVFIQDYSNYKVIYFDDASDDNSWDIIKKYKEKHENFKFISVTNRKYKTWFFYNLDKLVDIDNNDILVFLDGDDFFYCENVLSYLNSIYNQTSCWMTYGGMKVWDGSDNLIDPFPQNSEIPQYVKDNKLYRKDTWRTSHLKSMRGFLWKLFDKEDLIVDGKFIVGPDDLAIMMSSLEISHKDKVYRVTDPLYVYNHSKENGFSRAFTDNANVKNEYESIIRNRKPYKTLEVVTPTLAGGLGNQIFEVAAAASLAYDNDAQVFINNLHHILPNQGRNINNYIKNVFKNIPIDSDLPIDHLYETDDMSYSPIPYKPNIQLKGHFQSWKYFNHNKEFIQNLFGIPRVVREHIKEKSIDFQNSTGIQIRRGDYIKFPDHHPMIKLNSYINILNKLNPDNLLVFSDDIEWCKQNVNIKGNITFIQEEDYIELYMMTLCQTLIISNSSFGWWGAYLNKREDKQIYAPSIWFGKALIEQGFNINELILPNWKRYE